MHRSRVQHPARFVFTAGLVGGIGSLQDVIISAFGSLGHARAHMAVSRVDGRAHVLGIGPDLHDLIDAHIADGEILGRPDGRSAAIAGRSDAAAHIADMPGHIVGCHDLGGVLRDGVDNRVFDQGGQPMRRRAGCSSPGSIRCGIRIPIEPGPLVGRLVQPATKPAAGRYGGWFESFTMAFYHAPLSVGLPGTSLSQVIAEELHRAQHGLVEIGRNQIVPAAFVAV